jgi:hypothetical protein
MKPLSLTELGTFADMVFTEASGPQLYMDTPDSSRFIDRFITGDLPARTQLEAARSHIYVGNNMQGASSINVAHGIVSARALRYEAEVKHATLLIVSEKQNSAHSLNFQRHSDEYPPVLIVDEKQRANVFRYFVQKLGYDAMAQDISSYIPDLMRAIPDLLGVEIARWDIDPNAPQESHAARIAPSQPARSR